MNAVFYVYVHRRADSGEPFYIGKGRNRRAWTHHGRSELWTRIADKHGFDWEIAHANLTEDEAFRIECEMIAATPGLCNFTDGGEGISGYRHTPETRAAISAAHKGKPQPRELVEARAAKLRGKKRTPEQLARRVCPMKGKSHSPEARAKMSASQAGRIRSPETIAKTAAWHRGKLRPPEARSRMSASQPKRAVECITTGDRFISLAEAAAWLRARGHAKASKTTIWLTLNPKYKNQTTYGLVWRYA